MENTVKPIFFTAAGREWISSGWLSSVLMYLLFTAGGTPDAFFGASGGGLVAIWVLGYLLRRRKVD